ncbi:MAG: glutamine--tRNA ligase [Candidatus Dasytiphilus stammeri]
MKKRTFTSNFIKQIVKQDLENRKIKIVRTRFPPEPNGYLHIGHAKAICLNFELARDYQGECYLRLDDTNPVKETQEYVESIKRDVQWLGYQWSGSVRFSSNYFEQLYNYAVELINKGLAYVDELTYTQIREYRGTLTTPGKESPYRTRSIKCNLQLFEKMRNGEFTEGSACLRAKIDMNSNFIIMRDPVLYRIKLAYHHQTGKKWCIYPMYDFSHCISDALEGITHSLCTLEFQDNRQLYEWILNHININCHPRPKQYEYSRLNLESAVISKRKMKILVFKKIVNGWDDPRLLTISGLRRRGYTPSSIIEFCRRIGVTKKDSLVQMALLEACIREDLNKNAPRTMAVLRPLKIVLENLPLNYTKMLTMRKHPTRPEMGYRKVPFNREIYIDQNDFCEVTTNAQYKRLVLGGKVRLRNAYVITAERLIKDRNHNIICVYCTCSDDINKHQPYTSIDNKPNQLGIIHWVSALHCLPAEFRIYDRLFNIPNPDATEDFLSKINPHSLQIFNGFIEVGIMQENYNHYQFEREGYFSIDSHDSSSKNLVLNLIVKLRDIWNKKSF